MFRTAWGFYELTENAVTRMKGLIFCTVSVTSEFGSWYPTTYAVCPWRLKQNFHPLSSVFLLRTGESKGLLLWHTVWYNHQVGNVVCLAFYGLQEFISFNLLLLLWYVLWNQGPDTRPIYGPTHIFFLFPFYIKPSLSASVVCTEIAATSERCRLFLVRIFSDSWQRVQIQHHRSRTLYLELYRTLKSKHESVGTYLINLYYSNFVP